MNSENLGMLIVGSITAIGLIQLIAWIVVAMRTPALFHLTLGHHTTPGTCREHPEQG